MELSEQLEQISSWLDVQWVPRDQNVEADALANGHFAGFDPEKRIEVSMKDLQFSVLPAMLETGGARLAELAKMKEQKRAERAEARQRKRARKRLAGETLKERAPWGDW